MEDTIREQAETFGPSHAWLGERILARTPFARLVRLERTGRGDPVVLVVCPLSGHQPSLLFDMVVGLASDHDVHVLAWEDAKDIPASAGPFGLDDNIGCALDSLRRVGQGAHAIALSQSALPTLAATAVLSARSDAFIPKTLTLIAGKLDTRVNPARIDQMSRAWSVDWIAANLITRVASPHAGYGRLVYSAEVQRCMLLGYFDRQIARNGELFRKFVCDDGVDPAEHPFLRAFFDLIDLPAEWFLDTIALVYQTCALTDGTLTCRGERVDPACISDTALLTIEGELDDIAPIGQTHVAHALCSGIPATQRSHYVQAGSGHFGLFHGRIWREHVLPQVRGFIRDPFAFGR